MNRTVLNSILLIFLLIVIGLTWTIQRDPLQRNLELMPGMLFSIPYDAQSANPFFKDGKTAQEPIRGTIARGTMPMHYAGTPEDAIRAGGELANPFSQTDAMNLDRAGKVFAAYCVPCHGATGMGDGVITKYGFPPPPVLSSEKVAKMKDGQIFHILTYGQGNMPSLASQISRKDRWKVILKIRSFQPTLPAVGIDTLKPAPASKNNGTSTKSSNGNQPPC